MEGFYVNIGGGGECSGGAGEYAPSTTAAATRLAIMARMVHMMLLGWSR